MKILNNPDFNQDGMYSMSLLSRENTFVSFKPEGELGVTFILVKQGHRFFVNAVPAQDVESVKPNMASEPSQVVVMAGPVRYRST